MKLCLWKSLGATALLVGGAGEFALAADANAGAADAGPAAPPQQSAPVTDQLETITVTAEKIKEDVNKTPLAISVFSGTAMQEQGVVSIADLQNIDPELSVGMSPAGVNISLRGVSTTDVTSKGNQDIAFNVDGIFNGRPREQALSFFDLDRVEVLRGPQGTLYGHSATGGAINVITTKPSDEFDASGSAEIGNFNARRGMGVLNVPLIGSTLDIRVAVNYNVRDGYLNPVLGNTFTVANTARPVGDENNRAARVSALWKPTDGVSLLLTENTGYIGGTGSDYGALYDRFTGTGSAARAVYYNPMGGAINDSFHNFNGELNADLGPVHLTYDGAYDHYVAHDSDDESTGDPAGSGSYTWRNYMGDYTTTSHELRFSNVNPGFMDWVFGGNYFKEYLVEHDQNWATYVDPSPANNCNAAAPNLLYGCNNPNPSIVGPSQHKGEGVFGQVNFHLTDALKATFGARYSHDSMFRHATVDGGGAQPLTCLPPNDCVNGGEPDVGSESASKVTWRVGLDYQLTDAQMVYGYVATGYKPGGFNDPAQGQTTTTTYGPEELTAYEIGYKGEIAPSLQLNSDVYYYDFKKEQITAASFFGFGTAGPIILIYTKLAPAKFYGVENSLHWRPTKADFVDASISFERAYYGNLQVGFIAALPVDWTGKSLDNTPRNSGTLGYEHRFFMTDGGFIHARLQLKYSSSYYESDLAGSGVVSPVPGASYYSPAPAQYTQSAYTRTDFTLGYTAASGKYDVYGFVRNIEDKMQLAGAPRNLLFRSDPNAVYVNVTAPRTYGLHFDVRL